MAAAAASRRRTLPTRWLVGGLILIVLAIGAAVVIANPPRPPRRPAAETGTTVAVSRGTVVASVVGSGTVAATQTLTLPFQTSGQVTEVLAEEGETVQANQVLARLDDRDLRLQLDEARVSLQSAQASLAAAREGDTTPEELASSEANVRNAEAQLEQVRTGNVSAADIASAEAALRSVQAQLNELLAGPDAGQLSSALAQVEQARASLEQLQAPPSGEEAIQAEAELRNAEAAVQQAQAAYDRVAWRADISGTPESLALQEATNNLDAARARYDDLMKGPDPADLATAQSQLRDAEEQLRIVQQGPSQADIAAAQSSVDQARATLDNLRAGGSAAEIAAAQASVDQARANLDLLSAPASATDLQLRQAEVAQAEQAVRRAELALEDAILRAPFAGVVTAVDIVPGSIVGSNSAVLTLMDRRALHVELKLSENDVARVTLGQPVALSIASLDGWQAEGEVDWIAPAAETTNDVVTYAVRVRFPDRSPQVRVGMTANVTIVTAQKDDVLLVPNMALLPNGAGHAVQLAGEPGAAPQEITVETGLTDGTFTEIVGGLREGQRIVAVPSDGTQPPGRSGVPFGN